MKNIIHMKSGRIAVLIALLAMFASHSAIAANADGFTPFVATRIGYGTLGKTLEYSNYKDNLGSIIAGLSWRRFDVGAGIIYDSFHKTEFTANLSWTFR